MANLKQEQRRINDIEAAIRSLYDLFPEPKYNRGKTQQEVEIENLISDREVELSEDRKLNSLKEKLKDTKKQVASRVREHRLKIDRLMTKFRLRGESPALLDEIEKLSVHQPVVFIGNNDDY